MQRIIALDGMLDFSAQFLTKQEADELFEFCKKEIRWREGKITLFGKTYQKPRLECFLAETKLNYRYSGETLFAEKMPDLILELKKRIENFTNESFNAVLLNLYRDGNDSNGWHADNEKSLGKNPSIASLSLGETRIFELKHASNKKIKIALNHGSLVFMHGELQHFWKHQIPKSKIILGPRINLTFRKMI